MLKEFHYYDSVCITAFKIFEEKRIVKKIVRKFGFGKLTLLILITTRMVCFLN